MLTLLSVVLPHVSTAAFAGVPLPDGEAQVEAAPAARSDGSVLHDPVLGLGARPEPAGASASPAQAGAPVARLPCRDCTLQEAVERAGASWPPRGVRLHIDKSDHEMTAWLGDQPLKTWRVGLGDPTGDKARQGDRKTPTGTFRVVTRNPQSQFHLFLGLNYPLAEDADRGLAAGLITDAQALAIRQADAAGRLPPWNTRLGGAIGLHGGGGEADWTLGCVAITNDEMDALWQVARGGTVVEIVE